MNEWTYLTCHVVSLLDQLIDRQVLRLRENLLNSPTRVHGLMAKWHLLLLQCCLLRLRWQLLFIIALPCWHILLLICLAEVLSPCTSVLITRQTRESNMNNDWCWNYYRQRCNNVCDTMWRQLLHVHFTSHSTYIYFFLRVTAYSSRPRLLDSTKF